MPNGSLRISVIPGDREHRLTGPMTLSALALVGFAVTRFLGLDHAGISFCYFKILTGYACFTCGATRAFGYLSRLDVPGAFSVQPLMTIGVLGLLVWGALDAGLLVTSRRTVVRVQGSGLHWLLGLGLALVLANWIYLLGAGV